MKATVNAELFRLAYGAVSKEQTRYYLNGVFVEPHPKGGVLMVSTDGHRMMVVHDEEGTIAGGNAIVRLGKDALAQCRNGKKEQVNRTLSIDTDTAQAIITYEGKTLFTAHDAIIDGTFPDWRRVVPMTEVEPAKAKPLCLNPAFIGALADAAERGAIIRIPLCDGEGPFIVRFVDHRFFAVIMPKRNDADPGYLPSFMKTDD